MSMHGKDSLLQAPTRLNKMIASAGICSRRKADELISNGFVTVNGMTVRELGLRVLPDDAVSVHGSPIHIVKSRTWLLMNKPVRVVSTVRDPEGRQTVIDILPEQWKKMRLFPVGRLDYFSEGLLLLTNDGDFADKILHPRNLAPRVYHLLTRERPDESILQNMRTGMRLSEGDQLAPAKVRILPASARLPYFPSHGTLLEITLIQGVNRQIRRMCRDASLTVLRLARVAHGAICLGDLPPGEARVLHEDELALLRTPA